MTDVRNQTVAGRYQLRQLVGKGGMGNVFEAYDTQQEDLVALKLLKFPEDATHIKELEKRMQREINALRLVNDSRIIRLFDAGRDEQLGVYYTMELLPHCITLKEYAEQHNPSVESLLHILRELLLGLQAVHQEKLVHRDLKPSNILCLPETKPLQLKIIDFGIARWFSELDLTSLTVETQTGTVLGSPGYMPPEMWRGDDIDERTDLYQIGILAYELLAGELPFIGTPHQLMFQHLHNPMPDLVDVLQERFEDVDRALAEAINDWAEEITEKDPEDRFEDATDAHKALPHYGLPTGEIFSQARDDARQTQVPPVFQIYSPLVQFDKEDKNTPHEEDKEEEPPARVTSSQPIHETPTTQTPSAPRTRPLYVVVFGVLIIGVLLGVWSFLSRQPQHNATQKTPPTKRQTKKEQQPKAITPPPQKRPSARTVSPSQRRKIVTKRYTPPVKRRNRPLKRRRTIRRRFPQVRRPGLEDTLP
tara:strand:+ start:5658 stop:7088 length:1431 start_codon:yes stop_codon:yes gene_type:complete